MDLLSLALSSQPILLFIQEILANELIQEQSDIRSQSAMYI